MKIEGLFLIFVGLFFGAIGLIYWFIAYEDGGGMMLLGSCLLGLLPGSFYYYWHRRFLGYRYFFWGKMPAVGERPEDRSDASIAEGAGVISSFPGSSIWPLCMGLGAFLFTMTFIFGTWFIPPAVCLIVFALVGVTAESRRGGNV